MNWLLSLIVQIFAILTAFSFLILLVSLIGVYVIKPRWPEWWEKHICAPDPRDRMFVNSVHMATPPAELMLSNSYNA